MKTYHYYLTHKIGIRLGSLTDKIKGSSLENIDALPSGIRALGEVRAGSVREARIKAATKIILG